MSADDPILWQAETCAHGHRDRVLAGNTSQQVFVSMVKAVQPGSVAMDLSLLAIQRIYAQLLRRKTPAFLVNFVHDELVLEVREDLTDEISSCLADEMTSAFLQLFKPYNPEPLARDLVEVGTGFNYARAK
ncbi:MAG TPA: hypothetical protein VKB53_03835 [Gammaproteobacteria bacterium]|nr:hypothetical protein [Gammaproteobacteria bacterium]